MSSIGTLIYLTERYYIIIISYVLRKCFYSSVKEYPKGSFGVSNPTMVANAVFSCTFFPVPLFV